MEHNKENYYNELIRLMEVIDDNRRLFKEDDTKVPDKVMQNFGYDNDYYVDVRTLKEMIEVTLSIPAFLENRQYSPLRDAKLHNKRFNELNQKYRALYLQLLRTNGQGRTLKD